MLRSKERKKGQAILEMTFSMVVVLLMAYGAWQIFYWSGNDLAERRQAFDETMVGNITENYMAREEGPVKQLKTYYYTPGRMDTVFRGD